MSFVAGCAVVDHFEPRALQYNIVSPYRFCGASAVTAKGAEPVITNWDIEIRSVGAIYRYLGGIVRGELNAPVDYAYQLPRDFGGLPFFLFKVREGYAPGAVMAASHGAVYSLLPDNPDGQDKSTRVVSILTDLWALDSSAKAFPATSTVSVTTQQGAAC
ncbi:hypothetical protein DB459_26875 [Bradyrhizobium sp. WD16]|nr:hypothetical protein DB459_26875 [Bradyrhizobium sp. WD16]